MQDKNEDEMLDLHGDDDSEQENELYSDDDDGDGDLEQKKALHGDDDSELDDVPAKGRVDIVAYCVRQAETLCSCDDGTVKVRDGQASDMKEYSLAANTCVPLPVRGWARRKKNGVGKGRNFISFYRKDIMEFFQRGLADKGNKQHPAWMLEQLEARYPDAVALPSEGEIRVEVTRLMKLNEKGKPLDIVPGKRGRQGMDTHFVSVLEKILSESTTEAERKPAAIYAKFLAHVTTYPIPDNLQIPYKKQVLSKISSMKQTMKERYILLLNLNSIQVRTETSRNTSC
jgi:hypothetical protein